MVALGNSTENGAVIFAKNSDRDANEAHYLEIIPRQEYPVGSKVKCTYIEVPQVTRTNAVLLAKPFWIWGCEMGANEHGVVIGNEAIFTKAKIRKEPGLIGMDFIRLALERTNSAPEALKFIIDLLEKYGQSGNCSYDGSLFYHNSFLIADSKEAWVLETADYQWAALKVKDFYSISNAITIEKEWDLASDELVKYAVDHHWCKNRDDFNFKRCYSEFVHTYFSQADIRRQCSNSGLERNKKKINVLSMMKALRAHPEDSHFRPDRSLMQWSVCMHQSYGPFRISQSVGSMVSEISPDLHTHWLTGTSAPCTGLFKPVWIKSGLPEMGEKPNNLYNSNSLWWKHERLHREVIKDYDHRIQYYQSERDSLERDFYLLVKDLSCKPISEKKKITAQIFETANKKTDEWISRVRSVEIKSRNNYLYRKEWNKINHKACMDFIQ